MAAPLKAVNDNHTGLMSNDRFSYDAEAAMITCPAGVVTKKSTYIKKLEGRQYHFPNSACKACPLREQCTADVHGRKVFISDYYDEFQAAKAFNETEQAKQLFQKRNAVERKNNEMKNHNGLGHARTRSREKRRTYVKVVSMVVNLKQFVKQQTTVTLGFVRKRLPSTRLPILQVP